MKTALNLRLYLILDPNLSARFGLIETLKAALKEGVTIVQWRAPGMDRSEFIDKAQSIKAVCDTFATPLIIDDDVYAAREINAAGVHIGQRDMPIEKARDILGPDFIIGLSVSELAHMNQSRIDLADYLGLGPVFATTSKSDAAPPMGLPVLSHLAGLSSVPTVAIGGITAQNAPTVISCGVNGVAVISAICGQDDTAAATRLLASRIRPLF